MVEAAGKRVKLPGERLFHVPLALAALLLAFAVIAQPNPAVLLKGFWEIQVNETGLITDPMVTGGVGAALLNASVVLLLSTLLAHRGGKKI